MRPRQLDPLVALVVLDGWGLAPPGPGNAIELAETPVFDDLWARYPHTTLAASGEAVGLPDGQMGNSEVGHLTIGSGRVVDQDLMRVEPRRPIGRVPSRIPPSAGQSTEHGSGAGESTCSGSSPTEASTRTSITLRALVELARRRGMGERTLVHAFTDGRDVSPHAAAADLRELLAEGARIATVCGRYYAMDRDQRWERTERAFGAIVEAEGDAREDIVAAIEAELRPRGHGRVPGAHRDRRRAAARAGRTRSSSSTSGPTGPAS